MSSMALSRRLRAYRKVSAQLGFIAQSAPVTNSCCFMGFMVGEMAGSRVFGLGARKSTFSMKRPTVTPGAGPLAGPTPPIGKDGVMLVKVALSMAYTQLCQ